MTDSQETQLTRENRILFLFFLSLLALCCIRYFANARYQYRASEFPAVIGHMVSYDWNEFGEVGESELNVRYTYVVEGSRYFAKRKRFAWRHFASKSPETVDLAKSWGKGNQVRVFYDPKDPSSAALDNLFTKGDWKTLACGTAAFIATILCWLALAIPLFRTTSHTPRNTSCSCADSLEAVARVTETQELGHESTA